MNCFRWAVLLFVLILISPAIGLASTRGIDLSVKGKDGKIETLPLYYGSHALLVGVSDYTDGWPDLTSIPRELDELEVALKGQGFEVVKVINPDSRQLKRAYEDFIDTYGFDKESRLLFFYSGHGYSRTHAEKGYIVPTDAPDPRRDEKAFARKAIEMEQVLTWARRIESKHALFLFDSCFSGTVFQSRALPENPPHINAMAARPVRQFISAGSAGEEVPAKSVFVPSFIRAIEGEGDLDGDGYVTGTELGMFLNRQVTGYRVGQTPQYGKIRDPRLDQGDFVLLVGLDRLTDVRSPSAAAGGELKRDVEPSGSNFSAPSINGSSQADSAAWKSGRVVEVLFSGGYVYTRIDTGSEHLWLAAPENKIKVGDRVEAPQGMAMTNFVSKVLQRSFDVIYFVDQIHIVPVGFPSDGTSGAIVSIAELRRDRYQLSGQQVRVRGQVVKFGAAVLGKNWLHVQDQNGEDLTVTTQAVAKVGDVVLVNGRLIIDKDYGYGYTYDVILEDAEVQQE